MTREELINVIETSGNRATCPIYNCLEVPEIEGCSMCAEKQLAEYEKQIREKAIDEFVQAFKDYVYTETLRGNKPYWTVAIKKIAEQLKEKNMDNGFFNFDAVVEIEKNKSYNKALEDVYSIIISDIEDKEKVLKIQELVFDKKGITNSESERV